MNLPHSKCFSIGGLQALALNRQNQAKTEVSFLFQLFWFVVPMSSFLNAWNCGKHICNNSKLLLPWMVCKNVIFLFICCGPKATKLVFLRTTLYLHPIINKIFCIIFFYLNCNILKYLQLHLVSMLIQNWCRAFCSNFSGRCESTFSDSKSSESPSGLCRTDWSKPDRDEAKTSWWLRDQNWKWVEKLFSNLKIIFLAQERVPHTFSAFSTLSQAFSTYCTLCNTLL